MKKILLSLSVLLTGIITQAQPILLPNGDFENWTGFSYDNPDKWDNSNLYTVSSYNFANVSKVAGTSSGSAVRLETKVSGTDTIAAFISNSDDPISGDGGVPYTFHATNFHGAYRYNITTGDTAWIIVKFKKNGTIISDNIYPITGSQSTFTQFVFPLATLAQAPDTLIIAAISGNAINSYPMAGSWLELDELSFSDNTMNIVFQDGDFENWTAYNLDNPNDWTNYGGGDVSKTTDKHTGTYAMKLVSKDDGSGSVDAAIIVLGTSSQQVPGMSFTKTVDTLTGYYKYSTPGSDMGSVMITLTDANGMSLGTPIMGTLPPAASYTYFELPIAVSGTPASLVAVVSSSPFSSSGVDGSTLYVDNLRLKNSPNSVGRLENDKNAFTLFPNPAGNVLYIKPGIKTQDAATLHIYDMTGKVIGKHELKNNFSGVMQVPVNEYTPGIYQYEIQSGTSVTRGKFVKE